MKTIVIDDNQITKNRYKIKKKPVISNNNLLEHYGGKLSSEEG